MSLYWPSTWASWPSSRASTYARSKTSADRAAEDGRERPAHPKKRIDRVAHAIAHNWFGEQIYPAPFAALGLGEGLPEYATLVIDEARKGEAERRRRVIEFLHKYDEASAKAVEIRLGVSKLTDPPEQRAVSLAKAPLFFIALEDKCGEVPVRSALTRVVSLLRGQEVGYNDIRSAIEQTSGKDLAEFFRIWLYERGIPKDFRAKYEPANESHP